MRSFEKTENDIPREDRWIVHKELMYTEHHWLDYGHVQNSRKHSGRLNAIPALQAATYLEALGYEWLKANRESGDEDEEFFDAQETIDST